MSFDTALFEQQIAARGLTLGRPASFCDATPSTNDDALAAAKAGAPHGAVFGAETQSRGRGRRGSEWVSTPGAGLWFSLLLRPTLSAEQAPGLALCAGLAVRAAVARRVSAAVQVKWPNDVLAGGRKLAGILVESQLSGGKLGSVIVGIGINLTQTAFPESISNIATSLSLLSASDASREHLLADVLQGFEAELALLTNQGMSAVAAALRPHDALLGKRLRIEAVEGVGAGIDASGKLLVRDDANELHAIAAGHIELLTTDG
ncbi:MAG TPA: biotin--[acetyl-CoA-carboxylase] ligase [Polyangiaceae bacterium]|nr:biotin--[acetyl-CoA-carboxylase] ligase [Polyangiaceae bacterium]